VNNTFLETIKSLDGKIFHLHYHQKRYERVLNSFGIKDIQNLEEFLNPPLRGLYRCRLIYDISSNPHAISVTYHEYKKREINTLKLVYDDTIEYLFKSTSREALDALFTLRDGCDDVLIIKNNLVTDTTIANIAFYSDGLWVTPKKTLLKGTTRERLLDEGKIIEKDIKVDELNNFSKVALLNAMIDFDIISQNKKDIFC